jgi:gluconokinase
MAARSPLLAIRVIVLMGVSGAGKTTVGHVLAASLGWRFIEADDFHTTESVERMRRGIGLTDADRAPWLAALRIEIARLIAAGEPAVVACSALKAAYRRALVPEGASRQVRFVHLEASEAVLRRRLASRAGHYAGPSLLASQLATLERPARALHVDATAPLDAIVARIRAAFDVCRTTPNAPRTTHPGVAMPEQIACPKCNAPMQSMVVDGTTVDRCTACEGIWFDALEDRDVRSREGIDSLDPEGAQSAAGRDAQRRVECPRCHTPMIRMLDRRTREIWYESCPICYGKFFDAGEFRAIQPRSMMDALRALIGRRPS